MMKLIKQYELELGSVPFSDRDDEVVYIATNVNPKLDSFVLRNREEIEEIFQNELLKFRYEPCQVDGQNPIEPTLACRAHRISATSYRAYHLDLSALRYHGQMLQQFKDVAKAYSRRDEVDYRQVTSDQETLSMLMEMERLAKALKVKGVKAETFDSMIRSLEQPVVMTVRPSGTLEFRDLGGMQLRLNPVEKTLYILFLNHPEGIHPDAVVGYHKDLLKLYSKSSRFGEWDVAENVIDSLCAEDKNVLYSNISRLKSKFIHLMGARLAEHYIIKKAKDGLYKIALPPDMICWEDPGWRVC